MVGVKIYKFVGWYKGIIKLMILKIMVIFNYLVDFDDNDDMMVVYEEEMLIVVLILISINCVVNNDDSVDWVVILKNISLVLFKMLIVKLVIIWFVGIGMLMLFFV